MDKKYSRKDFFKKGAKGAAIAGVSVAMLPSVAKGAGHQEELATLIDISKCIGCEACVYACKEENESRFPEPKKPFPEMFPARVKVSDWSEKRDVTDRLTPYNWLFIQKAEVVINGKKKELTIPRRCMHCEEPPCVNLCPFGSSHKHDNGITTIDPDACLGGAKCKSVCPWHIPERQTGVGVYLDLLPAFVGNGVMYKCTRCIDRVEDGKQPACIEACPADVQKIGPREEIIKEAHAIAKKTNGYIYGEKENGGTNTIYVSPVPFSELNKAIEKGPGKPHLKPVKNVMAQTDNLAVAMFLAPLAGLAAGITRFYNFSKQIIAEDNKDV